MNRDILNIILNDVLYNDINSIKKTSLICKNIHNNIQLLIQTNAIKNKLNIIQKYSEPNKSMYEAAQCGHIDIVQLIIEKDVQRSIDWNWAMAYAARGGHIDIVLLMIEKGATNWNWTMLEAASCGYHNAENIVQLMIEKGANNWNETMCRASYSGHMNIVQLMIEKGANDWNGTMASAAYGGHMNIVQLMIEKDVQRSIDWNRAICRAATHNHLDIVRLIIEKDTQRSIDWNKTIGFMYSGQNSNSIIHLIITKCIELNVQNIDWNKIMFLAAANGNIDHVKLAMERGANNWYDTTLMATKYSHINIIQLMIDKMSINAEYKRELYWHLYYALHNGNNDILKLWIERKKKYEFKIKDWKNLFESAATGGNVDSVKLIIEKYEQFNTIPLCDILYGALKTSVSNGNIDIVELLIDKGCLSGVNNWNEALELGIEHNQTYIVYLMIENGALKTLKNWKTVIKRLKKYKNTELMEYIRKKCCRSPCHYKLLNELYIDL
jgi:ankyrin repeat protein